MAYPNYERLTPHHGYLSDEAVLVQAWKKSHEFLRRHSWYVDCLELDMSAVLLEYKIREWCQILTADEFSIYIPDPMRMVPAPKSYPWQIKKNRSGEDQWRPTRKEPNGSSIQFRPLAHIGIRDQTLATACMLCLANTIETAQGQLDEDPFVSRTRRAYSYGSRLLCKWNQGQASHQWANAEIYRRYYSDYQAFLARPQKIIEKSQAEGSFFIAALDLSKCYDRMSRSHLVATLVSLIDEEDRAYAGTFFQILAQIINWQWHPEDLSTAETYRNLSLRDAPSEGSFLHDGLPQGLVAAGFFSNAYLIPFDRALGALIGEELIPGVKLVDYCRYVDDIRLVLDCKADAISGALKNAVCDRISEILSDEAPGQKLNRSSKCSLLEADPHRESTPLAVKMQTISRELSRPLDQTNAGQALEILDGLMAFTRKPDDQGLLRNASENARSTYGRFVGGDGDVPSDRVERFVAHRWRQLYRHLVLLSDYETFPEESALGIDSYALDSREFLDKRASYFSRVLIGRWLADPSKVRLLRIAFDIYPDKNDLSTVCDFLLDGLRNLRSNSGKVPYFVAAYVASELLRAGVTETGFVRYPEQLARELDIEAFRNRLAQFAEECLTLSRDGRRRSLPPYLLLQMALFLTVNGQVTLELQEHVAEVLGPESPCCRMLRCFQYESGSLEMGGGVEDAAALLLAHRLGLEEEKTTEMMADMINESSLSEIAELLHLFWDNTPDIVTSCLSGLDAETQSVCVDILHAYGYRKDVPLQSDEMYLSDLVYLKDRPFASEIASLHLSLALLEYFSQRPAQGIVDPGRVIVTFHNRDALVKNPADNGQDNPVSVQVIPERESFDHRYRVPEWCSSDKSWRVNVGQLLRAAIIGQADFTKFQLHRKKRGSTVKRYYPYRSSWFKRRYGLFFGRSGLGGPGAPMSLWLPGFLNELLHWPGAWRGRQAEKLRDKSIDEMIAAVHSRLRKLGDLFGKACGTPVYDFTTDLGKQFTSGALTVAYVQTAFPSFDVLMSDALLEDPDNRRTQRRHLSAVLALLDATIRGQESKGDGEEFNPIDVLIFPELSIHLDDVRKLEQLAELHGTVIFAGLVYSDSHRADGGLVNRGIWLLPDQSEGHLQIEQVLQGKANPIQKEIDENGVVGWRPYQALVPLLEEDDENKTVRWALTGAICYDATQLELPGDLVNLSDVFIVSALNRDVSTFDNMTAALNYHMFQHVVVVNSGEFGGSTIQAPYRARHKRTLMHEHGGGQVAIGIVKIRPGDFQKDAVPPEGFETKTPPAGFDRRLDRFAGLL